MKTYLETVIAPRLQGDGGWLDVEAVDGDTARVQLQGECSKCNMAPRCMRWIEQELERDLGRRVTLIFRQKKPFFWDNE